MRTRLLAFNALAALVIFAATARGQEAGEAERAKATFNEVEHGGYAGGEVGVVGGAGVAVGLGVAGAGVVGVVGGVGGAGAGVTPGVAGVGWVGGAPGAGGTGSGAGAPWMRGNWNAEASGWLTPNVPVRPSAVP